MHSNRSTYTLKEYQKKLRKNSKNLGICCENLQTGNFILFHPIPSCPWLPESRKKYFKKLYSRCHSLKTTKKFSFCTLTYSSRFYTPEQAALRIKSDLDKFFKRLNYRNSKPEYFYVIELTDKLMVHIHLIFAGYVHKKKIFKSWNKVTKSISIRIKSLPYKTAVFYCMKYLTNSKKQNDEKWSFIFKNIDRIWTSSRKFFKDNPDFEKKFDFYFVFFNKDGIVSNFLGYDESIEVTCDLSPPHAEQLALDCYRFECGIRYK